MEDSLSIPKPVMRTNSFSELKEADSTYKRVELNVIQRDGILV